MGMDANINGRDVRLSGLLAETAFNLFPAKRLMANTKGYVDFNKDEVAELIVVLSDRIDNIKIKHALQEAEIPMDRVRLLVMTLGKLWNLMDWCQDADNDNKFLTFA